MRFAEANRISQPQIADMLRGVKKFGEKVALRIERQARMPVGTLVNPAAPLSVREPTQPYHGVQLTRAGALLGAEWEKLDVADRAELEAEILNRVAKTVRAKKRPAPMKSQPAKLT